MATNDDDTPSRRWLLKIAALVATGTGAAVAAPSASPDAELLRLCAAWRANEAEYVRLCRLDSALEEEAARQGRKVWDRERVDASDNVDEGHALLEEISETPARTDAGRRAKAEVMVARVAPDAEDGPPPHYHDEYLAWSIARDVLASAGGAA